MATMATATTPLGAPGTVVEEEVGQQIDDLFDDRYAVIILDSDVTTFAEVEQACMELFGYSGPEAAALAMRVHTTGAALAAVMAEGDALLAVRQLRQRNVRARSERL